MFKFLTDWAPTGRLFFGYIRKYPRVENRPWTPGEFKLYTALLWCHPNMRPPGKLGNNLSYLGTLLLVIYFITQNSYALYSSLAVANVNAVILGWHLNRLSRIKKFFDFVSKISMATEAEKYAEHVLNGGQTTFAEVINIKKFYVAYNKASKEMDKISEQNKGA